ncbi:MAG TPA: hypothetical protein VL860_12305 [Planctomycetota bacterium]|nr:hypothetical protein [Planctomycetota bacterium]
MSTLHRAAVVCTFIAGIFLTLAHLAAANTPPAEPAPQTVPSQADASGPAAFATPGCSFVVDTDPAAATTAFYLLGKTKVRLEYRDQILHLTVLTGLLRLDLASGAELLILSPGDDIEIAGLTPAAYTTAADRTLLNLFELPGDPIDAGNHRLRLARTLPLRLRNNGGYPIAVNAQGRMLRLDEGGSGIALNADGSPTLPPAARRGNPRNPDNPARGGHSPAGLLKP